MKVLIAGAGPGGLSAALHLHAAGMECEVFEAAAEIRALGVGLNLLPHAVRELSVVGLGGALADAGIATGELGYYSRKGVEIWREPRGIAAGYKWPQYSIHRGKLQGILLEEVQRRLGASRLHTAHQLAGFEDQGNKVTARFVNPANGSVAGEHKGDILIGADGVHSAVRKFFYPEEKEPLYSGRVLWRATVQAPPFLTGRSMIMAGYADRKFVAYPLSAAQSGRATINWVADVYVGGDAPIARDWNRRIDKQTVLEPFRDWRFDWLDIPELIQGAEAVYEYPLVDRDPVAQWSFGRVTLLGDAAHPMYPVGSNGASQAILDAAALTAALVAHRDPVAALAEYEASRLGKTSVIVHSNRRQGPEIVMQMVQDRAPEGFVELSDVISREELEEVANRYKAIAGFDRERLNAMPD